MPRTLILMRHGQATSPAGTADHERPLTPTGAAQAEAAGRWFAADGRRIDTVLCSSALRTRETFRGVSRGARWRDADSACTSSPALYNADATAVLGEIALASASTTTLLVIGHFPGLPEAALVLDPAGAHSGRVRRGMPVGAYVTMSTDSPWAALPDALWGPAADPFATITGIHMP
ncbi:SixA phosphatase family protein [Tomitella fengzijianii]|nr:histidine phosphatase family protein [Tomitella fengzijianii]